MLPLLNNVFTTSLADLLYWENTVYYILILFDRGENFRMMALKYPKSERVFPLIITVCLMNIGNHEWDLTFIQVHIRSLFLETKHSILS